MNKDINETIRNDELSYEKTLYDITDRICGDRFIKAVLIAGGSCSGKTTTTKKLAGLINASGRTAYTVSLDDYYRNRDESVYLPDGTRDIETINSLRVDLIRESLGDLLAGREAKIPLFDFKTESRTDDYRRILLGENDVILIEGLHALSPELFAEAPPESAIYRIYLYASSGNGADCRFVRRLVRDSRHRNADAEETYSLWDNVKKNESEFIEPFREYADVTINTFFDYERAILNDDAVMLLKAVRPESVHYESALKLIAALESAESITDDLVPENSLLREFM